MELISSIIGRSQATVNRILGFPNTIQVLPDPPYPNSVKCCYKQEAIEVIFIDQVADWITVNHTDTEIILEFIHFIGVFKIKPTYRIEHTPQFRTCLIYRKIEGIKEIKIYFTLQKEIEYLSIKAFSL